MPRWGMLRIISFRMVNNGEYLVASAVRLGAADAPAESSRFSSYWDMLPSTSCPSACHSFQYFQPPQSKYRPVSDGTR